MPRILVPPPWDDSAIVTSRNYCAVLIRRLQGNEAGRVTLPCYDMAPDNFPRSSVSCSVGFTFLPLAFQSYFFFSPLLVNLLPRACISPSCPCGGQRIPSASSAGNPRPTIIWGEVLSVKHVATFTFYFQNPLGIYQLKEICISVRTDLFVGICSFLCRCYPKFGKESKRGGLRKKCMI